MNTTPHSMQEHAIAKRAAFAIAEIISVLPDEILSGASFMELYEDFDSLALIRALAKLEQDFGFEIDLEKGDGRIPMNIYELAKLIIAQSNYDKNADSE